MQRSIVEALSISAVHTLLAWDMARSYKAKGFLLTGLLTLVRRAFQAECYGSGGSRHVVAYSAVSSDKRVLPSAVVVPRSIAALVTVYTHRDTHWLLGT